MTASNSSDSDRKQTKSKGKQPGSTSQEASLAVESDDHADAGQELAPGNGKVIIDSTLHEDSESEPGGIEAPGDQNACAQAFTLEEKDSGAEPLSLPALVEPAEDAQVEKEKAVENLGAEYSSTLAELKQELERERDALQQELNSLKRKKRRKAGRHPPSRVAQGRNRFLAPPVMARTYSLGTKGRLNRRATSLIPPSPRKPTI